MENKVAPRNQPAAQHPGTDAGTVHAPPPVPCGAGGLSGGRTTPPRTGPSARIPNPRWI